MLEMEMLGFVSEDVTSSMSYLLKKGLIEADSSVDDEVRAADCYKATASGWAHMRLLASRSEYLVGVLPTTPIDDEQLRAKVFDAMQLENRFGNVTWGRQIDLMESFKRYLEQQDKHQRVHPGYAQLRPYGSTYVIEKVTEALRHARREESTAMGQGDLLDR